MADLDPQQIDQLNESLRRVAESLEMNSELLSRTGKKGAMDAKDMDALGVATRRTAGGFGELTQAQKAAIKAEKEAAEAAYNLKRGFGQLEQGTKQLGAAILDSERNFKKYNQTLSSVGDAAVSLGKTFGAMGTVLGYAIKGATKIAEAYTKQADNVLKASDAIAKFSGAGARTTSQLLDLAHAVGLTSKDLDKLTKPLSGLGQGLVSLGTTAGDGVNEFTKLAAVGEKQRENFQRMGVSQEELIQNQADYLKLQQLSGVSLSRETKDRKELQRASLEYTENLLQLAAFSGQDIETIKKKQQAQVSEVDWQIKVQQMEKKERDLRVAGRDKEADQVKLELENRKKLLNMAIATGDEQTAASVRARLATDTWTETSSSLAVKMGKDFDNMMQRLQKGEDVSAEFIDLLNKSTRQQVESYGDALKFNKELQKQTGISSQLMQFMGSMQGKSAKEMMELIKKQQDAAKAPGTDTAQDARAKLTTLEIKATVELDKLIAKTNPLIEGFNKTTIAAMALYAAATAAALALTKMAMTAGMGALGGRLPGTGGTVPPGGAAGAAGAGRAAMLARAAGGVGLAAAGGYAVGTALNAGYGMVSSKMGGSGSFGSDLYSMFNKEPDITAPTPVRAKPKPSAATVAPTETGPTTPQKQPTSLALPKTARAPSTGSMSEDEIKKMIMQHEGVRYEPYQDSRGLWTVGVGHLIGDGKKLPASWNRKFSHEEVMKMFDEDYKHHRSAAERIPGFSRFNSKGQGALTDLTFNMGPAWWQQGNRIQPKLAEGDGKAVGDILSNWAWYKQVGNRAPTIVSMLRDGISAASGGITKGPSSGYPATLHGTEVITPLEPNSILEKLAKTSADSVEKSPVSSATIEQTMKEMNKMHADMMAMFESKLDEMISQLETGNSTQEQLLKHSRT